MAVDVHRDTRPRVAEMLRDNLDRSPGEQEVGREGVPEGVNVPVVDPGGLTDAREAPQSVPGVDRLPARRREDIPEVSPRARGLLIGGL